MTTLQKVIKYLAIAFAVFLAVSIVAGILWAVGLLGSFFDGDAVTQDQKLYSVTTEIRDLEIRINAADITIREGDTFAVESNLKYLEVEEKGNVLTIRDAKKLSGATYQDAVLTVYLPAGTIFETVTLNTGACRLTVEQLTAGTLDFELGAGDVSITSLIATKSAGIEGGTGRITISGGVMKDLDLEMGMGQLNLTSTLTGDCQLDLGMGESNITLLGKKDNYRLELEKGLGSITVDGKNVSNYSSGNGANRVDINGGVGAIHVRFE